MQRSITDRLDALNYELRDEMAAMELRLSDRITSGLAAVSTDVRELRAYLEGIGALLLVASPIVFLLEGLIAKKLGLLP